MYGPVLSALLLGMIPVWGIVRQEAPSPPTISVAPPANSMLLASVSASTPTLDALSASGILVIDMKSGQRVFSRNIAVQRPMASLTKQMTALLIVERYGDRLDEWATVPPGITSVQGSVAALLPRDEYTIGDLLSAMLVASANDAAVTLAEMYSGSTDAFVLEMNQRAAELGLRDTVFANPAGLDDPGQYSTPQDLAWLAMFAMRYPQIRDRMGMREIAIHSRSGKKISLSHTHALLHQDSEILAGKTGTTNGAGQCLLSLVEEHGRQYLVVLLGSGDRYRDMRAILDALRV